MKWARLPLAKRAAARICRCPGAICASGAGNPVRVARRRRGSAARPPCPMSCSRLFGRCGMRRAWRHARRPPPLKSRARRGGGGVRRCRAAECSGRGGVGRPASSSASSAQCGGLPRLVSGGSRMGPLGSRVCGRSSPGSTPERAPAERLQAQSTGGMSAMAEAASASVSLTMSSPVPASPSKPSFATGLGRCTN